MPTHERIDYLNFDIAQADNGIIYFANKSGVVQFDGRNWSIIETPGAIYSLSVNGNEIFAAGLDGFGQLVLDDQNDLVYKPLSSSFPTAKNVFSSETTQSGVYFSNENAIYYHQYNVDSIQVITIPDHQFTGLYRMGEVIYTSIENGLLLKIDGGKAIPADLNFIFDEEVLFVNNLKGGDKILIATTSDHLFVYDGKQAKEIDLEDEDYISSNIMVDGCWVNEGLIAIGTLRGGVIFIDPATGKTEQITNYYTGLPDNEVFALLADRNQGVWVAHDYGFTRIAPYLPFRPFNHYPGLAGNLLSATSLGNQVYVGTSVGLFRLAKEEVYGEEIYYVTKKKTTAGEIQEEQAEEEREKSKRGLFSFLRKKKNKDEPKQEDKKPDLKTTKTVVEKRTRRVLKSLQYAYRPVEGIKGKVTQLSIVNNQIIASGIGGVYEVSQGEAKQILSDPVRTFFFSPALQQLLVSTYEDRLKSFNHTGKEWKETHLLDTLHEFVGGIFEDNIQNVWLCGRAAVIKVEVVDNEIEDVSRVPFSTLVLDEATGFSLGNDVYVAASGAFHRYDVVKNQFVKYDSLPGPRKYFTSGGSFWFNDGHHWKTVNTRLHQNLNLQWLALFPDIRFLTLAEHADGLWIITSGNELYRFSAMDANIESGHYPLLLKEVRSPDRKLPPVRSVRVSEQQSNLTFEFIQPEFTSWQTVEYQYMIQGINNNWTDWSPDNNVINFSYLPAGKYTLQVKSRNILGQESQIQPIVFNVIPPYWQQTWFYALEFIFFGSLVLLTVRLGGANSKYRYLSRLLSVLTVIMLIQFIQTAAESFFEAETPVIGFFVQVVIALLVLPLEGFLRKFMTQAAEKQYALKRVPKDVEKAS